MNIITIIIRQINKLGYSVNYYQQSNPFGGTLVGICTFCYHARDLYMTGHSHRDATSSKWQEVLHRGIFITSAHYNPGCINLSGSRQGLYPHRKRP